MNNRLQWDDLRVVLAVAEEGSLSGAGRRLGLSHATVFRRLGDIERRLGVALFERTRGGYSPTPAGEEAAAAARRVEVQVLDVERRLGGRDLRPSGTVRVTTTDTLHFGLLSPILASFQDVYPEILLEVSLSNQVFNLSRREADVAIRPSSAPPETLVGRKIGVIDQAVYGARDLFPDDRRPVDLRSAPWVVPDEAMPYRGLENWMRRQGLEALCRCRVDSVFGMFCAAREGAGLSVLPCYLGDAEDGLVRVGELIPELATDLWLLTHPDLRRTMRIRALMDFIAEVVKREGVTRSPSLPPASPSRR